MSPTNLATATTLAVLLLALLYTGLTIVRLRGRLARAEWAAGHDPLTGLPNRTTARRLFTNRAAAAQATVVALLDLTRFKHVNDTHGHHTGDQLLCVVAHRLATAAGRYGGHAARLAGDEFLLLLPIRPGDPVEPVACILAELTTPAHLGGGITLAPAANAGVAVFDGIHGTWNALLRRADIACYHAKTRGTWYQLFHPGMAMPTPAFPAQRHGPRVRDLPKDVSA